MGRYRYGDENDAQTGEEMMRFVRIGLTSRCLPQRVASSLLSALRNYARYRLHKVIPQRPIKRLLTSTILSSSRRRHDCRSADWASRSFLRDTHTRISACRRSLVMGITLSRVS